MSWLPVDSRVQTQRSKRQRMVFSPTLSNSLQRSCLLWRAQVSRWSDFLEEGVQRSPPPRKTDTSFGNRGKSGKETSSSVLVLVFCRLHRCWAWERGGWASSKQTIQRGKEERFGGKVKPTCDRHCDSKHTDIAKLLFCRSSTLLGFLSMHTQIGRPTCNLIAVPFSFRRRWRQMTKTYFISKLQAFSTFGKQRRK